jgi:hypothetical protein
VKVIADTLANPLSRWMTSALASGEYGEPTAEMSRIQDDLERLSDQLEKQNGRFVVMIDDLDRCEPDKIVEVLQAINLLLNFESYVVCLGIDARVVTRAIDKHYEGLLREAGASGFEYLDKIVQIPFRIPRPSPQEVERFVASQLGRAEEDGPSGKPATEPPSPEAPPASAAAQAASSQAPSRLAQAEEPAEVARERPEDRLAFSETEIEAFKQLAPLLDPNPRHLKRLINVYRLVRSIAGLRHEQSVLADPNGAIQVLALAAQWPYTAAAMLERLDTIVEQEAAGGSWPKSSPLKHLHSLVSPHLDTSRQAALDRAPDDLAELLKHSQGHLRWKALARLRRYVINFNPAVEQELRLARWTPAATPPPAGPSPGSAKKP